MGWHNDTCGCADCGNYGQRYNHSAIHNQSCGCPKCDNYGPTADTQSADPAPGQPAAQPASYGPGVGATSEWGDGGDCCAMTTCPKCVAPVYFVRHRGGSVWFDNLGPSWPNHRCFANDPATLRLRSRLVEREIVKRVLFVGVAIKTVVIRHGKSGRVVIEYGGLQRYESEVIASADLTVLPGNLVLATVDDDGYPRLH